MTLFENKRDCCACGACVNICPRDAISFVPDEYGFMYPNIDEESCIHCGACERVCDWKQQKNQTERKSKCYFAVRKDKDLLKRSTSGGMFSVMAENILEDGGIVFGCTLEKTQAGFFAHHIGVAKESELERLRGSKYVQSNTENTFSQVRMALNEGKKVLYCGTPCQIAGLKSFLKKKYETLYTIDLICHGAPNQKLFNDFIRYVEKKRHWKIGQVEFRKKYDNVNSASLFYFACQTESGSKREFSKLLSYYGCFLDGDIYRESCYHCRYACPDRVGDITLGDGWGIEATKPMYLQENGGMIDVKRGVNCMMVNSAKGWELLQAVKNKAELYEADFADISAHNHQLLTPSKENRNRKKIFELYQQEGYAGVDRMYFENIGMKKYVLYKYGYPLMRKIPAKWKMIIKQIVNKV